MLLSQNANLNPFFNCNDRDIWSKWSTIFQLRRLLTRYTSLYVSEHCIEVMFHSFFENVKSYSEYRISVCSRTVYNFIPCLRKFFWSAPYIMYNHICIHCSIILIHMRCAFIFKILNSFIFLFSQMKLSFAVLSDILIVFWRDFEKWYFFNFLFHWEIGGIHTLELIKCISWLIDWLDRVLRHIGNISAM